MNLFDLEPGLITQAAVVVLSVLVANFDYRKRLTSLENTMREVANDIKGMSEKIIRHDERLKSLDED